jgi:hypothetical protein
MLTHFPQGLNRNLFVFGDPKVSIVKPQTKSNEKKCTSCQVRLPLASKNHHDYEAFYYHHVLYGFPGTG